MGALAGQGIRPPEALHPGAGLAVLAGFKPADGALRFHAGVGMDEDIRRSPKMLVEDVFQLFDLSVAGFQEKIPGEDKVEIDEDMGAGPAGPELMDVDPHGAAVIGNDPADLF